MPKDEFDFDDPMELNGVGLVCEEDTTEPMTECFVEEFMRLGYNHKQMLALFRNPHYIGMNMVLQNKGEQFVRDKIAEVFARWGRSVTWSGQTAGPLTPALSPSEGERGKGRQSPGESGAPRLIRELDAIPPLPQGEGRGEGDCLAAQRAPDSPAAQTVELDATTLDPTGTPVPKLNL
ncbi:MAG: hypothetical protein HYY24_18865 [Verrucomicrobia bacterium]|nr:hypothetical protein [Verrucomicrobiota bacterium]